MALRWWTEGKTSCKSLLLQGRELMISDMQKLGLSERNHRVETTAADARRETISQRYAITRFLSDPNTDMSKPGTYETTSRQTQLCLDSPP